VVKKSSLEVKRRKNFRAQDIIFMSRDENKLYSILFDVHNYDLGCPENHFLTTEITSLTISCSC